MCGIIAYTGTEQASPILMRGLRQLEYRGYDSAGVSVNGTTIRSVGDIAALSRKLAGKPLVGTTGIAHTRWATHGAPTLSNTHPHTSGAVTLVHNGVLTNYQLIKDKLGPSVKYLSETDSEVLAALIDFYYTKTKQPLKALSHALQDIEGSWAIAVVFKNHPEKVFGACNKSPLLVAETKTGTVLISDQSAVDIQTIYELDDHSIVECRPGSFSVFSELLSPKKATKLSYMHAKTSSLIGEHPDFMHKEIFEQTSLAKRLLASYAKTKLAVPHSLSLYGCGSAYHAALAAKYELQPLLQKPIYVELATDESTNFFPPKTTAVAISQSGETADTLSCFDRLLKRGVHSHALVNNESSRLARHAQKVFTLQAGQEVSVASTKAFFAQLLVLRLLCGDQVDHLQDLPALTRRTLALEPTIKLLVSQIDIQDYWLVLGKDSLLPIALETALKIREITYLPCFAVSTSEMKHGTHALLSEQSMTVFFLPSGPSYDKQRASLDEVCARSTNVLVITDSSVLSLPKEAQYIQLPFMNLELQQFSFTIIGQLLAYHLAKKLGRNIDKPRNLAKSVTVE